MAIPNPEVWNHDALAADLARWLKAGAEHWVWLNSALGEWGGPRPDVMAYRRFRYTTPVIRAYECKISRADLLSDLRAEKWRSYLEHCASVTFIMPSGLCKKEEIPAECGVMFRSARGWRTERRPQDIGTAASVVAMAKLLTMHPIAVADASDSNASKWRQDGWRSRACRAFLDSFGKGLSTKAASYWRHIADGNDPVEVAHTKAAEIIADAEAAADRAREHLIPVYAALGVDPAHGDWGLATAIRERTELLTADGQLEAVRARLDAMDRELRKTRQAVTPAKSEAA